MKVDLPLPQALERIVADLGGKGGRSYLVGGAIVDHFQGKDIKDLDVEVYGLSYQDLLAELTYYGEPNLVGQSFGVVKLKLEGIDYDFSLPRKENRTGAKHKDFDIQLRPDLTPQEAAERRDLTINSLFIDLSDKTLHDYYGGMEDLKRGILRHTSEKFSEDPLRVLRVMQLLPRKGKSVAPETSALCRSLTTQYDSIASERVYEEWNKLLLKSDKPSIGLRFLEEHDWLGHFPELATLRYIEQRKEWHPEGNVWNHTCMVIDKATALRDRLPEERKLAYMYGVLLHDVGKATTTTPELTSPGHDSAGVPIAEAFMRRLTNNKDLIENIITIVGAHMRPGQLYTADSPKAAWKRLHNVVPLNVIGYVSRADSAGKEGQTLATPHGPSERALAYYEEFGPEHIPAVINGKDILALGIPQGKRVGELLDHGYRLQLDEDITDKRTIIDRLKREYIRAEELAR